MSNLPLLLLLLTCHIATQCATFGWKSLSAPTVCPTGLSGLHALAGSAFFNWKARQHCTANKQILKPPVPHPVRHRIGTALAGQQAYDVRSVGATPLPGAVTVNGLAVCPACQLCLLTRAFADARSCYSLYRKASGSTCLLFAQRFCRLHRTLASLSIVVSLRTLVSSSQGVSRGAHEAKAGTASLEHVHDQRPLPEISAVPQLQLCV